MIAGFVLESPGEAEQRWTVPDIRSDIRFPVCLPATISVDAEHDIKRRIADSSFSGLRLVLEEPVEMERNT